MNFNSLFFPAPKDHYSCITHFGEMIYIPKDHEMVRAESTGEEVPRLVLPDNPADSQTHNLRSSPKHLFRNSSQTNVSNAIGGQATQKTGPDTNRQQEISIVMQGNDNHPVTESHMTEEQFEPLTQSKSQVSGLGKRKILAEGLHIPCLLIQKRVKQAPKDENKKSNQFLRSQTVDFEKKRVYRGNLATSSDAVTSHEK